VASSRRRLEERVENHELIRLGDEPAETKVLAEERIQSARAAEGRFKAAEGQVWVLRRA
jgi:hypothetical protein